MPWTPFGPPVFPFWTPADDGFLGANLDPAGLAGSVALTAGNLYLARLPIRAPTAISNLWVNVGTVGAGASSGSFAGLCAPGTGTLLTGSADVGASFTGSTGWKQLALTAPQSFAGGPGPASWPYALILCNLATTQVSLVRGFAGGGGAASPQAAANAAQLRFAQQAGFGTALANVSLASNAATAFNLAILWS